MSELRRFVVEDGSDLTTLVSGLEQRAPFEREPGQVLDRTFYDTFDWRVHGEGGVLELTRSARTRSPRAVAETWMVWRAAATGEVLGRWAIDRVPEFVWDLPDAPTTRRLAAVVEMRALRPLVTIRSQRATLRLIDGEGKTEARVVVEEVVVVGGAGRPDLLLAPTVEVQPVRGYPRATDRLSELLAAQVVLRPADRDLVEEALAIAGFVPGDYSSKLRVALDGDAPALDAVVAVLHALLDTMAVNEPGTRLDLDSEFLHDYRVAVRRARSVLAMAKGVVPPDLLDQLRADFKWLGDITTPTRDLDVYVLTYADFEATLPPALRPDLHPLLAFLVERQHRAHAELVSELDSPRYSRAMDRIRSWLADPGAEPHAHDPLVVPEAEMPTSAFSATRIWRAYRSLVRDGRRITPYSPPEALHDLRKDAKKLRYALECFGSVFPAGALAPLVKELKGVQDVLGEFQDCEVQKGSLRDFGEALVGEQGTDAAATLMAMGYLIEQLDEREREARAQFAERFAFFDRHHNRAHFRQMFGPPEPAHPDPIAPEESSTMSVEP